MRAEHLALRHLEAHGLNLLQRNYRCRLGEIDLIMQDGDCIVFVEVRFRSSANFVAPALTVDNRKQRKIAQTAAMYLAAHRSLVDRPARFDVVAADRADGGPVRIQWIQDAFRQ